MTNSVIKTSLWRLDNQGHKLRVRILQLVDEGGKFE